MVPYENIVVSYFVKSTWLGHIMMMIFYMDSVKCDKSIHRLLKSVESKVPLEWHQSIWLHPTQSAVNAEFGSEKSLFLKLINMSCDRVFGGISLHTELLLSHTFNFIACVLPSLIFYCLLVCSLSNIKSE